MGQPEGSEQQKENNKENNRGDFNLAANPNPRANENIRVRTESPKKEENKTNTVGSEITDGEGG